MLVPLGGPPGPPRGPTGVPPFSALFAPGWAVVGGAWVDPSEPTLDVVVGGGSVEPCEPTLDVVVGGGKVEPCEPTLDVVVPRVVGVVEVVGPMHGPINRTEVDPDFVKPSLHRTRTRKMTFPVAPAARTVLAGVVCDGLPLAPTFA